MSDVPLDTTIERISGSDEPHELEGLPGQPPAGGLAILLGWLRANGTDGLRLALPIPGDPLGLAGPTDFNEAAVAAAQAVVALGCSGGLVPDVRPFGPPGDVGHQVRWHWHPGALASADPPSVAEADRELAQALLDAAAELTTLDAASWRDDATGLLTDLRTGLEADLLPRTLPQRARSLIARALRLTAVLHLALDDDGGAGTVAAAAARRAALAPLERSVRRALVAACSAPQHDLQPAARSRRHVAPPPR